MKSQPKNAQVFFFKVEETSLLNIFFILTIPGVMKKARYQESKDCCWFWKLMSGWGIWNILCADFQRALILECKTRLLSNSSRIFSNFNTCRIGSEVELLRHFAPSKSILCLDLHLVISLLFQLGQDEGRLVLLVFVSDSVLRSRNDHAGPCIALLRIVLALIHNDSSDQYERIFNKNLYHSFQKNLQVFSGRAGDIALCWHSCQSSIQF